MVPKRPVVPGQQGRWHTICNSYPRRPAGWRYERGNLRAHKKPAQWDGAPESGLTGLEAWRMVFMPDFPPVSRIVELTRDYLR